MIVNIDKENLYSNIVYTCDHTNVKSVMIDGNWIYQNYQFMSIDVEEVIKKSQEELSKLLLRVK